MSHGPLDKELPSLTNHNSTASGPQALPSDALQGIEPETLWDEGYSELISSIVFHIFCLISMGDGREQS